MKFQIKSLKDSSNPIEEVYPSIARNILNKDKGE